MFEYLTFTGRCNRLQYWGLTLFIFVSYNIVFAMSSMLGDIDQVDILSTMMLIVTVILHWSTLARRTRDTGLNAWWCLLTIIPYFGILWLLLLGCFPSLKDDA